MLCLFIPLLLLTSSIEAPVRVRVQTEKGEYIVAVRVDKAPVTARNFLRYVDEKAYDHGRIHRTVTLVNQPDKKVKIEVIQGGPRKGAKEHPPIKIETTKVTGLKHLDGTISMARDGPNSATSDFFVCIGKQPELDYGGKRNPDGKGFAAFGQVVEGMEVVRRIQTLHAKGQTLTPPVTIIMMQRIR